MQFLYIKNTLYIYKEIFIIYTYTLPTTTRGIITDSEASKQLEALFIYIEKDTP